MAFLSKATIPTAGRYDPLELSSKQIRLLRILPSEWDGKTWFNLSDIRCELVNASLDDLPDYEALSYTWGSADSTVTIKVDGEEVCVRENLAYALAACRTLEPRILWVDAICINQDNIHERNHQVGQMGEIYRRSKQVLVWLGREQGQGSRVATAISLVTKLGACPPTSTLPRAPDAKSEDEFAQNRWIRALEKYLKADQKKKEREASDKTRENAQEKDLLALGESRATIEAMTKKPKEEDEMRKAWQGLILEWQRLKKEQRDRRMFERKEQEQLANLIAAGSPMEPRQDEMRHLKTVLKDMELHIEEEQQKLASLQKREDSRIQEDFHKQEPEQPGAGQYEEAKLEAQQQQQLDKHQREASKEIGPQQSQKQSEKQDQKIDSQLQDARNVEAAPELSEERLAELMELKEQQHIVRQQQRELRKLDNKRWEIEKEHNEWQQRIYYLQRNEQQNQLERKDESQLLGAAWRALIEKWREMEQKDMWEWEKRLLGWENSQEDQFQIGSIRSHSLLCLASICDLPYWSRLWIVQEVLLGSKVTICFGDDERTTMDWTIISKARNSLERIPDVWELPQIIGHPLRSIRQSLPFKLDKQRQQRDTGWPLHALLLTTENSLCHDPRDKIYGLLGLASDFKKGDLDIDYSKSLSETYQDIIRWYHKIQSSRANYISNQNKQETNPSLVRFSELVQMSFKGHLGPGAEDEAIKIARLEPFCSSNPSEMFRAPAISEGTIFPVEEIIDERDLISLRQRDWVFSMVEFLQNSGQQESRNELESKLVYLDSIETNWAITSTNLAYVATAGSVLHPQLQGQRTTLPLSNVVRAREQRTQFFMVGSGEFGIASNYIRENDMLCRFKSSNTGIILRRKEGHLTLVSKAILSPKEIASTPSDNFPMLDLAPDDKLEDEQDDHFQEPATQEPEEEETIDVVFDVATLQSLTRPFKLTDKHKYREPLCIQVSSFGWYEFISMGQIVNQEYSKIKQPAAKYKLLQAHKVWKFLSSMVKVPVWTLPAIWIQPLKRLWLLLKLFAYLTDALKRGGVKTKEIIVTLRRLWTVVLSPLKLRPTAATMKVVGRQRRMAIPA